MRPGRGRLLLSLGALLVLVGCGDGETPCERTCRDLKPKLESIFGAKVDCTDEKWKGSCAHCEEVLHSTYAVQMVPGSCS
jgi:hypothetical protein